jgi:hypothetical protein
LARDGIQTLSCFLRFCVWRAAMEKLSTMLLPLLVTARRPLSPASFAQASRFGRVAFEEGSCSSLFYPAEQPAPGDPLGIVPQLFRRPFLPKKVNLHAYFTKNNQNN